jgi:hypothetical protein
MLSAFIQEVTTTYNDIDASGMRTRDSNLLIPTSRGRGPPAQLGVHAGSDSSGASPEVGAPQVEAVHDRQPIAGVVHADDIRPGHSEYERNRMLLTAEANAAIRGDYEFDADALVLVADDHAQPWPPTTACGRCWSAVTTRWPLRPPRWRRVCTV